MRRLIEEYPGAECALHHESPYELLVATILSAQSTDEQVNKVTHGLFAAYPRAADLAGAAPGDVQVLIRTLGLFRSKAANLVGMAQLLVTDHGGEVPTALEALVTLPGVGRKTANVVRSVAFALPGLPVDTHVGRLSRRLGLTTEVDPPKVERDLNHALPAAEWGRFSLRMILHGRQVCTARRPRCDACVLADFCPSAGEFA